MIVAYATQAGRTAEDGDGRNSPYTAAFLRNVEAKEEIGTIFRRVSADVYQTTRQSQLPELSLSLIGEFYLNGKLEITVAPTAQLAPADHCAAASDHWKSAEAINTIGAFEDHLARFPNCAFAGLARARIEVLSKAPVAPNPVAPQMDAPSAEAKPSGKLTATGRPILDFGQNNPVPPVAPSEQPPAAVWTPTARPSDKFTATGRPILSFEEDATPQPSPPAPETVAPPANAKPSGKLTATGRPILDFEQK
jgi:hypothetical protein